MDVTKYLKNNIVILDGGMGTLLQERGLKPGEHPERWNISHPNDIVSIHKAYYEAGSNIVNTNTFGANSLKFEDSELEEIIGAAILNAKKAREESGGSQLKYVALDIGPCGKLLKPYGDLDFEKAVEIFAKIVRLGVKYRADLITIETMNDSYETKAALLAAKENSDLPVIVTNAFGADGKLMTGANAEAMTAMLEGMRADAIGVNCSLGPKELLPVIESYLKYASVPVIFKPNAGLPKIEGGKAKYDVSADEFAGYIKTAVEKGVRIVGGCCGTTPRYIKAVADAISGLAPLSVSDKGRTVVSSYTHAVTFGGRPVIIGERINPTGKKRFKQALVEGDISYILGEGIGQQEKGADVLDVNVGLPDINEPELLLKVTEELQAVINLPLQIDTADAEAMERALRRVNGKALINSVSGKEDSMRAIFPLAKKYGGVVIALTLDEKGIPETAEGRLSVARSILKTAAEYGIAPKDIIFDPLTLTISANGESALVTLKAIELIEKELGCCTSL
ncbi:MAG: homocysteine S-methyltransferase family protein, partial [Firmicutes bacterium]|nr:homocysteine S-methyltransferase family protein [Bacillota bacterium]